MADSVARHSLVVRFTHWITTLSFFALLISGIAILLAHPRLYWGETGAVGSPSLFDLPVPFKLGHSGWGRSLHFLSAWVCVPAGLVYVVRGVFTRHFRFEQQSYNLVQRLTYLAVVFTMFPLIIATGLAMSPAITSVVPSLVEVFGGHQSARTLHFFGAIFLVVFLIVHVAMICRAGFVRLTRAMIAGHAIPSKDPS